ncbi:phosphoenolpyruvate carboxykinase [Desulfosarcina ovata subsp. sediminis]|uniref:phosphoenolpyruvate carboxykinase (GTP) n=1 Tax=Desulfosarcina ovata subsp. sediminis TaxID=885957 RepID=A0A5K7ZTB4_9BACT|nr:phosphoenolpyruvate carboxykinase (GTP) [Desulfosarcina ovata]BBO83457.1 phosphoenolpyruvate carboxykinase [Desulfosarcina ovata subsp. sediminis]
MLKKNEGIDIVKELGGIQNVEQAQALFEKRLDSDHLIRIRKLSQPEILIKIANAIAMCDPARVYINTGSAADRQFIRQLALNKGEEAVLPMDGHTIHYDLKEEQGRIIDRTFYIANPDEKISSLANKILRDDALVEVRTKMAGIMSGGTMVVGLYMRGPVGAAATNPALELTSSAYVSHSAEILYRNAFDDFEKEVERLGHFYTNIHSEGLNRAEDLPNARVFMDRSHRTTYSFNCTYAGNTLLLKKGNHRFSVDKAVYEGEGRELAEHMFITGIDGPDGRVTWVAGAAPSGCGKTTTAMAGNHFVGDDLAQMWIDESGSVRSINPECGIFGIVEDVNGEGDPMLMDRLRNPGSEVIWTNVLIDETGTPHWTGNGEAQPIRGRNFQGPWKKGLQDANGKEIPISHPNARCTISSSALANYSEAAEAAEGVETRVITYSGRDSDTMPPVWVAKNSDHGVAIGACIVSAATATEVGASGVKRAPWANAPFIPGALGDYMKAQFDFFGSAAIADGKRPIMAGLNYFLTHEARGGSGKKLLGEKKDVKAWLAWLEQRAHGDVDAIETPIGFIPRYADMQTLFETRIDKAYPEDLYNRQFSLYVDNILARIDLQIAAYSKEENIPPRLFDVLKEQRDGLVALKEKFGPIVTPKQLSDM